MKFPDFKELVKKNIKKKLKSINSKKSDEEIFDLSLYSYLYDLDKLNIINAFGEKKGEIRSNNGEAVDYEKYKNHNFRFIDIRKSVKRAVRHLHKNIVKDDLVASVLKKRSETNVFLLLDSSGSMVGKKMYLAKRACIALAYKIIEDKNKIGFIGFNDKIITNVSLTNSFSHVAGEIVKLMPKGQTDISIALDSAIMALSNVRGIKHIILISDMLESFDDAKVYSKASLAKSLDITISVVTTNVEDKGKSMSYRIVEESRGKYYHFKSDDLENIILEDYSYFS